MDEYVPTLTDLGQVYQSDLNHALERYARIKSAFLEEFGAAPDCYARSPGRVNLIGEHIDYEGYAVFPMAILQDTVVAVKKCGSQLVVANLDKERYPSYTYSIDPTQTIDTTTGAWTNYFLAAYKGVYEFLESKGTSDVPLSGLQVLIHGDVPTGSGLSSSSALVCASAMAILAVHGILTNVTKAEIAEFTCTCERHSGTESGGMDQAISIMAKPGFAKLINFNPVSPNKPIALSLDFYIQVRGVDVSLPSTGIFVVANSLTVSNKAETAAERYNLRVVECRTAAMLIAHALGLSKDQIMNIKMLKEIEDLGDLKERTGGLLKGASLLEAAESTLSLCQLLVKEVLRDKTYNLQEIEEQLGFSLKTAFQGSPNGVRVLEALEGNGMGLQLHKRALHVFGEASRVMSVKQICEDKDLDEQSKLEKIGQHMNASHASCRDLYDCSCPELEELIVVCNSFGAVGSRLTGAGWGGCAVSLIREEHQNVFIQNIKAAFYSKRVASGLVQADDLDRCVFASKPSGGGSVLRI